MSEERGYQPVLYRHLTLLESHVMHVARSLGWSLFTTGAVLDAMRCPPGDERHARRVSAALGNLAKAGLVERTDEYGKWRLP